ncbi:MAG: acetyl-CoA carboxylase biotin carboxyl carrier protein [Campylobacterota bacterium]|nr:acetyl-CoA carboxylase biotin carboxyl carrier protein [Campylobacterota bacterium]
MNIQQIKELMGEFDSSSLSKITINQKDFELKMEKATLNTAVVAPTPVASTPVQVQAALSSETPTAAPKAPTKSGDQILSPMVGTFYASPSPDSAPFVKVGDTVKQGQALAVLEAMKIMNELEADFDCKIVEILVKDSQAVEYDMPLFIVEKI